MSKFEHMTTLRFNHRSELLNEFHSLLATEIPRQYLEYMMMTYSLTPDDLSRAGVRYLGGRYEDVMGEIIQRHGSAVLIKAGILFQNRKNDRTFLRFAPPLWKKVPLLIAPGRSEGFVDQLIGFAPVADHRLAANDIERWYFTKHKSASGQGKLIGLDNPVADGIVFLCSDFYRSLQLRKHGYEAFCVSQFRVFKPSWFRKFGQCRVYVETSDALDYHEELERVFEMFATHENELRVADTVLSQDYMRTLRKRVGLPLDDPAIARKPEGPGRTIETPHNTVTPRGEEYIQASLL